MFFSAARFLLILSSLSAVAAGPHLEAQNIANALTAQAQGTGTGASSPDADALISFLQSHPDLLSSARVQIAQSMGVDPSTVTDQQIYDHLRQDPALTAKVMQSLQQHGYSIIGTGGAAPAQLAAQAPTAALAPGQASACPVGYMPSVSTTPAAATTLAPASSALTPSGTGVTSAAAQPAAPSVLTSPAPTTVCVPSPVGQGNIAPTPPAAPQANIQQRQTPYSYITPLNDLYTQILPPDNSTLQRFGSNVFVLGTGNTDALPMDLPAGSDYVLGTGDTINVNIWGTQTATLSLIVDRQGEIVIPQAGTVVVSGLTIGEAQKAIQNKLATQFKGTQVELSLGRVRTVRIYVVGDVQRPGAYDISSLSTPINALYAAGGPTATGSMRILKQYRGNQLVKEIDLYDFLLNGVRTSTERLLPGDTLLVPPVGPQVSVNGMVRRPAIYEIKGKENLKEAIEMAGGVLVGASLGRINVERIEPHQHRVMLSIQTPPLAHPVKDPLDVPELTGFDVQDGDAVTVRPILPYNEDVVYLDGHVYRPGKYPYHEGMTVSDLLHSNQDLMPEPAERLELIRLVGPDYHPETTLLSLQDVLQGNHPILLKPFDYLRAFSRYEVDTPQVTIAGEVIRPGTYPMSAGMKASDLVRMAGGFRRSAYRDQADLSTYEIQDGKQVLIQTGVIDIQKALDGDASADITLKPGEMLSIRQISGWQDIGSSVSLSGEVFHPGTYGIVLRERLSSVLKRAGGFREDAFPEGIVLERTAVRVLNQKARQDMIQRIEALNLTGMVMSGSSASSINASSSGDLSSQFEIMRSQQQEVLTALRTQPINGRIVITISKDISKWENTPADVELRADDTIVIPKRNDFIAVIGQVFDQTTLVYQRNKTVRWYLQHAGGPTRMADTHNIYVVRADGSHISRKGVFDGDVMSARLRPGDSIVVPERFVGMPFWRELLSSALAMAQPVALVAALASN